MPRRRSVSLSSSLSFSVCACVRASCTVCSLPIILGLHRKKTPFLFNQFFLSSCTILSLSVHFFFLALTMAAHPSSPSQYYMNAIAYSHPFFFLFLPFIRCSTFFHFSLYLCNTMHFWLLLRYFARSINCCVFEFAWLEKKWMHA